MKIISSLLLLAWYRTSGAKCSFNNNSNEQSKEDVGKPLILTKYIENCNFTFARNLARVQLTDDLGIKSYSGYFTVNKKHNSNQFFWYFPPTSPVPADAPVILWLQGGPGSSSLFGLFAENGPIEVVNGTFTQRKYHWAIDHHVIYIDNPVGTGFSFTDKEGYAKDEVQVGAELYESLIQFFRLFPELKQNKFYITGESYAGKYVPALGYTIHVNNINSSNDRINLKGHVIGNGYCDPVNQLSYGRYLYQLGLVDSAQLRELENYENKCIKLIEKSQWEEAADCVNFLFDEDTTSLFYNLTGLDSYFNYLHLKNDKDDDEYAKLLVIPAVRKAIHVGDQPFNNEDEVEKKLKEDSVKSVVPWIVELLNYYDIVFYSGQLDVIVPYPFTEQFLQKLPYVDADKFKTAKRYIWRVDGDVAGYVKTAGKLTEILVRNAGHMVPKDQPKWALDLITRITHEITFS